MSTHSPRVSIIVPVHNDEVRLPKCLESLCRQTLAGIEVLVIDDRSTDRSLEVARSWAAKDSRIRVFEGKKPGAYACRNQGLELATGEFVGFVDSDDFVDREMFERLVELCEIHSIDCSMGASIRIDETTGQLSPHFDFRHWPTLASVNELNIHLINGGVCNKLFRRSVLERLGLRFREYRIAVDLLFNWTFFLESPKVGICKKTLYYYTRRRNSLVTRPQGPRSLDIIRTFRDLKRMLEARGVYPDYQDAFRQISVNRMAERFNRETWIRPIFLAYAVIAIGVWPPLRLFYDKYVREHRLNWRRRRSDRIADLERQLAATYAHMAATTSYHQSTAPGTLEKKRSPAIVVSLTTTPKRINRVHLCIESIFMQSVRPDHVILWLDSNTFKKVPGSLEPLIRRGLEVRFCEDLRSYKKLHDSLIAHPNDIIITSDDDVIYPERWIEGLMEAHRRHPDAIVCYRGHRMLLNRHGYPVQYKKWMRDLPPSAEPELSVFPVGIWGILYPPRSLDPAVLDSTTFLSICPTADDVWFKAMSLLNGRKALVAPLAGEEGPLLGERRARAFVDIFESQATNLFEENRFANDWQIRAVFEKYGLRNLTPRTLSSATPLGLAPAPKNATQLHEVRT